MLENSQNKMMTDAPAKKEFHFAATSAYCAEVVYAATIEEAEAIYHTIKRFIEPVTPAAAVSSDSAASASEPSQALPTEPVSTPQPEVSAQA
jgi:adenylosuccinate lyase